MRVMKFRKEMRSYKVLSNSGILEQRANTAYDLLRECILCPRKCGVNRLKGEKGYCEAPEETVLFRSMKHLGEEPAISGTEGSGVFFFSHCNLRCVYCQNYPFSQNKKGDKVSCKKLSARMIELQKQGCMNINLVTATPYLPHILYAIDAAVKNGLDIPVVYNTSGYEDVQILKLLDGVVDVYLTDMKYADNNNAKRYSYAEDYPNICMSAISEMHLQVGDLQIDHTGMAQKGLIVRHLVLPGNKSNTEKVLNFVSEHISGGTWVSLMAQYIPAHKACNFPEINRSITKEEYENACEALDRAGINNGWIQTHFNEREHEEFFGAEFKQN
ncbi:MAG: radical SAM protein [Candidatus Theseobacter exili]|nr:radical SAM protein [Candidatus Theseobacter exili]